MEILIIGLIAVMGIVSIIEDSKRTKLLNSAILEPIKTYTFGLRNRFSGNSLAPTKVTLLEDKKLQARQVISTFVPFELRELFESWEKNKLSTESLDTRINLLSRE